VKAKTKNPLGLRQSGFPLALAVFIKRPQAELKSAHYESDYPLRIRAVKKNFGKSAPV